MGVTIHYEGKLASQQDLQQVIQICKRFSSESDWPVTDSSGTKTLMRVIDEQDCDYTGPVSGVIIRPPGFCEPLEFEFGTDLFLQSYCKTQFAGADLHIRVIALLRELAGTFATFNVQDEGEYWDSQDRERLDYLIEECNRWVRDTKAGRPGYDGPIVLKNGRVADLARANAADNEPKRAGFLSSLSKLWKG